MFCGGALSFFFQAFAIHKRRAVIKEVISEPWKNNNFINGIIRSRIAAIVIYYYSNPNSLGQPQV